MIAKFFYTSTAGAALTVALAFGSAEARGGEPDAVTGARVPLDTVTVTASRRERPLREVANSVTVLDAGRMDEILATDLKDLARYVPGLSVGRDPSRFGLEGFTIRGIGANRIATEIDGSPVADTFSVGSYASARRDLVNPALLKRVEFLRGPASALYGSDAVGGVVSYTTWRAEDFLDRTGRAWFAGMQAGYRGVDDGASAAVRLAAQNDSYRGLVMAAASRGNAASLSAPGVVPNPREHSGEDVLVRLTRQTANGELDLTLDYHHAASSTDVDDLEGRGRFASTTLLAGDDRQFRRRIALSGRTTAAALAMNEMTWHVAYQRGRTDQRTVEERAASARSPSPTRRLPEFIFEHRTLAADASLAGTWESGGAVHKPLVGGQIRFSKVEEYRDNMLINLDDGSASSTILGETFPVRDFPPSNITELALFAHDEIVVAGGRLTLIPALRIEHYSLDPQPDNIYRDDNPSSPIVRVRETSLSPKLGLVWQASARMSIFAQYAHGFRSPPFEDANIGLDIPLFNIRAIPNPDLEPEISDGLELGLRIGTRNIQGTVSVFHNWYRDFIETKVNLGPDPDTGTLIFQSLNRERATIHGAEAELFFALDDWLPGLGLHTSVALARGEDRGSNSPLNAVDPDRAVVALRYDHPVGRWGTELIASFARGKRRVDDGAITLFRPPGYGVLDALAWFRLSESVRFNLGLFNLTDRTWWDWTDVRGRPADDPLIGLYSRPGFNVAARLQLEW